MMMAEDADLTECGKSLISDMENLQQTGRDQGLEGMHNLQAIASVMLKYEKARLQKKLGKDHSRVRDIKKGISRNTEIVGDLSDQIQNKSIRVPEIKKGYTLLHGQIKDDGGQSLAGLTVWFADQKRKELPIKDVKTNDAGYFSINLAPNLVEEIKDRKIVFGVKNKEGEIIFKFDGVFTIEIGQHKLISAIVERSKLAKKGTGRKHKPEKDSDKKDRTRHSKNRSDSAPTEERKMPKDKPSEDDNK